MQAPVLGIEPGRTYSLTELIDLAEAHNSKTRVAWERARAQAAALGIARSDLVPTLAAVAQAGVHRIEAPFGSYPLSPDYLTAVASLLKHVGSREEFSTEIDRRVDVQEMYMNGML